LRLPKEKKNVHLNGNGYPVFLKVPLKNKTETSLRVLGKKGSN
jgi:hypothetical protein